MASHDYALFGLHVRSEIELPELALREGGGAPDVRVRPGAMPDEVAAEGYSKRFDGTLLAAPEVGRYLTRGGEELVVARRALPRSGTCACPCSAPRLAPCPTSVR